MTDTIKSRIIDSQEQISSVVDSLINSYETASSSSPIMYIDRSRRHNSGPPRISLNLYAIARQGHNHLWRLVDRRTLPRRRSFQHCRSQEEDFEGYFGKIRRLQRSVLTFATTRMRSSPHSRSSCKEWKTCSSRRAPRGGL